MIFYYLFLQMWAIFDNIEKKNPFFSLVTDPFLFLFPFSFFFFELISFLGRCEPAWLRGA